MSASYSVSIYLQGDLSKVVELTATSSIIAIDTVEANYKRVRVKIPWLDSTPLNDKRTVEWSGYTFIAREIE